MRQHRSRRRSTRTGPTGPPPSGSATSTASSSQPPGELGETAAPPAQRARPSTKYADLALDGQARLEIRTDRLRKSAAARRCRSTRTPAAAAASRPPRLDNQVNIRSSGLLGQRVHVNVDFDTERDFNANNNSRSTTRDCEDEIVRRIDVGTVMFQPPASRFITAAIPANNFGVNATFEVGPVQLQTLAATQKGSVVAERTYTVGQTTSQPQDRQVRDLDFESGRFFWIVDPDSLPGYPGARHPRALARALSPTYRPGQVRIYRYRPPPEQERRQPEPRRHHRARAHRATRTSSSARSGGSCWSRARTTTSTHPGSGSRWPPSWTRTTTWPSAT